jgi:hypothetical protein
VILAAPDAVARIVSVLVKAERVTVTIAEPLIGIESGLGLTTSEHGVGVGLETGVGVSVTVRFEKPIQRRLASSYRQSSRSPEGWTATARPSFPFVR